MPAGVAAPSGAAPAAAPCTPGLPMPRTPLPRLWPRTPTPIELWPKPPLLLELVPATPSPEVLVAETAAAVSLVALRPVAPFEPAAVTAGVVATLLLKLPALSASAVPDCVCRRAPAPAAA